jgi:hypothetical protein
MSIFKSRTLLTLSALLAFVVFSGDVLDDVCCPVGSTTTSVVTSQQQGATTKVGSTSHDDTVVIAAPSGVLASPLLLVFEFFDLDQHAPPGEARAIDHPPQLV